MSHDCRLFGGPHGITFNTTASLFVVVNSDRSRFGALANSFCAGDTEVVNTDVERIKRLLKAIESCYRVVDSRPTSRPSVLRGSSPRSYPTPDPPPKANRPKTSAPPAGTKTSYPPMRPKWDEFTDLAKVDKVCCACFCAHTWAQGYMPLSHAGIVISNNPEGYQCIIYAYTEKKKTWEEAKSNTPSAPNPRGQYATSLDSAPPPPPIPAKDLTLATVRLNYWDALGLD